MPSNDELRNIAAEAEQGLNTYQSKTGNARGPGGDLGEVSGVDSRTTKHFPGSELRYGDDLTTSASYDRNIPVEEGGSTDAKGRVTTGKQFEGAGGPERKDELNNRDRGGRNDQDVAPQSSLGSYGERETKERRGHEQMDHGMDSSDANVGRHAPGVGGPGEHPGAKYEESESVPDQFADQGNVPPKSAVGKSAGLE